LELGVAEPFEDLLDRGAGDDAALGVEVDVFVDDVDVGVAQVVGPFVFGVGAVGVGQCFPPAHDIAEVFVRQGRRVPDEHCRRVGQLVGAARVGMQPGQQP
jgi:hypothetical protein